MPVFDETTGVIPINVQAAAQRDGATVACLIVIAGSDVGKLYVLSQDEISIGRVSANTICITDDGVSRRHALVRRTGPQRFMLKDLGSTNGTFCNGARVVETSLNDGDKVMIGSTTILKFSFSDSFEKRFQEHLFESSLRDWLTKCYNKRYLTTHLDTEFASARRHGRPLSLLMLDIDKFKAVNDTYGHSVGDMVLRQLAQIVAPLVPEGCIFARYGGEEFAVLLPQLDGDGAYAIAERIRQSVAAGRFEHEGKAIPVTVSIGVATCLTGELAAVEELVRRADESLYRAKNAGRNRTER